MREQTIIKLKTPILMHDGPVSEIILQEPTFEEYMTFGDPATWAAGEGGTPFAVENMDVIRQYLSVCLVQPKDPALLQQASARVARQVKEAILGFFHPGAAENEASAKAPTTSPSEASASNQKASND